MKDSSQPVPVAHVVLIGLGVPPPAFPEAKHSLPSGYQVELVTMALEAENV